MTDKELENAVERILGFNPADMFGDDWYTDWRVAGAVMERMTFREFGKVMDTHFYPDDLMAPRAIIEAGVAALQEHRDD